MDWIRQGLGRHAQNLGVYPESDKKVLMCLNQEDDTIRFSFSTKITLTLFWGLRVARVDIYRPVRSHGNGKKWTEIIFRV